MELRLLGPVEVGARDRVLDVGGPRPQLVLAALAVDAGQAVSVDNLIGRVWDNPPQQPRRALQVYLSRVRRLLASAGPTHAAVVVRRTGGYLLDMEPDRIDMHRFRRLTDQARRQEMAYPQQWAMLGQALALWQGQPFADLPGAWVQRVRQSWWQRYLEAVVAWAWAGLRAGEPAEVLPRLCELTTEYPLVESLAAMYMRALYASGRPADALAQYATVRSRLAEELGTEPGPDLRRLYRQLLSADPALASPATAAAW